MSHRAFRLPSSFRLSMIGPALALVGLAVLAPVTVFAQEGTTEAKTIVLGFDGADAALAQQWIDAGELPNLARLAEEGTFAPLRSTIPSQTPVSWSTFATGLTPGRHAVFDFLKRDPATYRPGFAAGEQSSVPFLWGEQNGLLIGLIAGALLFLIVFLILKLTTKRTMVALVAGLVVAVAAGVGAGLAASSLLPTERPIAINAQQGATVWEILGDAGKRVQVVRIPVTFPPEPFEHGELLSGLGVPDMSGSIGKPYYFTSELFFQPKAGNEFSLHLVELIDNRGEIPTEVAGPPNLLFGDGSERVTVPMTLTVSEDRSRLGIEVSGQSLELGVGDWSEWIPIDFPFNSLIELPGMGRFHLISLEPEVRLYLSPVQFDPTNLPAMFDITAPADWVDHLSDDHGRFKTMGWAIDTWSISEGTIDEAVFLEDVNFTVSKFEEMLLARLAESADWDVLIHYFEFTDRVQHMMWRYFDTEHPMYDAEKAAQFGGSILEAYKRMDEIVGKVLDGMPEGTNIFVVSDHGFQSFRWGMNYNTWLVENGYMTLEGQSEGKSLDDLFGQGEFFTNVDWSRTKAYSLGLGQMYINLAGREAEGIVQPGEEYRALVAELKAGLESFVDPATGLNPVAHVFTRDEAYGTYDPELIPDMIVSNSEGYRVGWQDSLGAVSGQVIEVNDRAWSGDHCSVYPPLVNGILFSNLKLSTPTGENPYMADIMPTLLELYGAQAPEEVDGVSLLGR